MVMGALRVVWLMLVSFGAQILQITPCTCCSQVVPAVGEQDTLRKGQKLRWGIVLKMNCDYFGRMYETV